MTWSAHAAKASRKLRRRPGLSGLATGARPVLRRSRDRQHQELLDGAQGVLRGQRARSDAGAVGRIGARVRRRPASFAPTGTPGSVATSPPTRPLSQPTTMRATSHCPPTRWESGQAFTCRLPLSSPAFGRRLPMTRPARHCSASSKDLASKHIRGVRPRDPQVGTEGLPERPSTDRSPPAQGPHRLEGVAGRNLARLLRHQNAGSSTFFEPPPHSGTGSIPTSARPTIPEPSTQRRRASGGAHPEGRTPRRRKVLT